MRDNIDDLIDRIALGGTSVAEEVRRMLNEGTLLAVPFKKGEAAWHVYPMSKTNPKRGYTKRLVFYEQIVAGLAKDPNGIYCHNRAEADRIIEELKVKCSQQ